jgi:transcriptional regulator with XRE-family HTH domain
MTDGSVLLRDFMREHDITLFAAAKRLGVSRPTVNDWRWRKKSPTLERRRRIARWTRGAVPVDSWLTAAERRTITAAA